MPTPWAQTRQSIALLNSLLGLTGYGVPGLGSLLSFLSGNPISAAFSIPSLASLLSGLTGGGTGVLGSLGGSLGLTGALGGAADAVGAIGDIAGGLGFATLPLIPILTDMLFGNQTLQEHRDSWTTGLNFMRGGRDALAQGVGLAGLPDPVAPEDIYGRAATATNAAGALSKLIAGMSVLAPGDRLLHQAPPDFSSITSALPALEKTIRAQYARAMRQAETLPGVTREPFRWLGPGVPAPPAPSNLFRLNFGFRGAMPGWMSDIERAFLSGVGAPGLDYARMGMTPFQGPILDLGYLAGGPWGIADPPWGEINMYNWAQSAP